jgi:hypothetical protein
VWAVRDANLRPLHGQFARWDAMPGLREAKDCRAPFGRFAFCGSIGLEHGARGWGARVVFGALVSDLVIFPRTVRMVMNRVTNLESLWHALQ